MKLRDSNQISRRAKKRGLPWLTLIILILIGYGGYWLYTNPPQLPSFDFDVPKIELPFAQSPQKRLVVLYIPGLDANLYTRWIDELDALQSTAENGSFSELAAMQPHVPEVSRNAFDYGMDQTPIQVYQQSQKEKFFLTDQTSSTQSFSTARIKHVSTVHEILKSNEVSAAVLQMSSENSIDLFQEFLDESTSRTKEIILALEQNEQQCIVAVWNVSFPFVHQNYPALDEGHPLYDIERAEEQVSQLKMAYLTIDGQLKRMQEKIQDEHTEIILVSDIGLPKARYQVDLSTWLQKKGYFVGDIFNPDETDWQLTRAFATRAGDIYINLENREPNGSVTQAEYDMLVQKIQYELQNWRDHRWLTWDEEIVQSVITNKNQHEFAPDLHLNFYPSYTVSDQYNTKFDSPGETLIQDISNSSKTISFHSGNGFVITSWNTEEYEVSSVADIAPLILKYFEVEIPDTMQTNFQIVVQ